jgi:hypothetical protein
MVHAGTVYSMQWSDGERLTALCNDQMNKLAPSQPFSFIPRDTDGLVTIHVSVEDPIELLTNYGSDIAPGLHSAQVESREVPFPPELLEVSI